MGIFVVRFFFGRVGRGGVGSCIVEVGVSGVVYLLISGLVDICIGVWVEIVLVLA